jgi:hypothetical protein
MISSMTLQTIIDHMEKQQMYLRLLFELESELNLYMIVVLLVAILKLSHIFELMNFDVSAHTTKNKTDSVSPSCSSLYAMHLKGCGSSSSNSAKLLNILTRVNHSTEAYDTSIQLLCNSLT